MKQISRRDFCIMVKTLTKAVGLRPEDLLSLVPGNWDHEMPDKPLNARKSASDSQP